MSTTVLEALRGGLMNIETVGKFGLSRNPIYAIGVEQLKNGIKALENGKGPDDVIQEQMFGDVNVGEASNDPPQSA